MTEEANNLLKVLQDGAYGRHFQTAWIVSLHGLMIAEVRTDNGPAVGPCGDRKNVSEFFCRSA